MREILFRGKRKDTGEWIYGHLHKMDGYGTGYTEYGIQVQDISTSRPWSVLVDPATVGQWTGLTDKNGEKIFEGDIVRARDDVFGSPFCNGIVGKVVYEEAAFFIETQNVIDSQYLYNECAVYEVIGNIYDNPELMKEGEK